MLLFLGTTQYHILKTFDGLKDHILSLVRPSPTCTFGLHDPSNIRYLFQLRVPSRHEKIRICSESALSTHRAYALLQSSVSAGETTSYVIGGMLQERSAGAFPVHIHSGFSEHSQRIPEICSRSAPRVRSQCISTVRSQSTPSAYRRYFVGSLSECILSTQQSTTRSASLGAFPALWYVHFEILECRHSRTAQLETFSN